MTDAAFQSSASVITASLSKADLTRMDQYVGRYASRSSFGMSSSMYVMMGSSPNTRPFKRATGTSISV